MFRSNFSYSLNVKAERQVRSSRRLCKNSEILKLVEKEQQFCSKINDVIPKFASCKAQSGTRTTSF